MDAERPASRGGGVDSNTEGDLSSLAFEGSAGRRLLSVVHEALFYTASWGSDGTGRYWYRALVLLARVLQRVHFLLLAAFYDACFGLDPPALPDGAALEAGCSARATVFRILSLGRPYGLRSPLAPFVWLLAVCSVCIVGWMVAVAYAHVSLFRLLRMRTFFRGSGVLLRPVVLVPVFIVFFEYLSSSPDRPPGYPTFWDRPEWTGIAALVGAVLWLAIQALVGGATADLRRSAKNFTAEHTGTPEFLLALATAVLVGADYFVDSIPAVRGAVQLGASLALVTAPAFYFMPFHRPFQNALNCAWATAVPALYCASIGLRAVHGETGAGASLGLGAGVLAGTGAAAALAGVGLFHLRCERIIRRYEAAAAVPRGVAPLPYFARPVDAVIAGRIMAARVVEEEEEESEHGPPETEGDAASSAPTSARDDPATEATPRGWRANGTVVPAAAAAAKASEASGAQPAQAPQPARPFTRPSDETLEELYLRAAREWARSPRVLVACAGYALHAENIPLCLGYLRRLRQLAGYMDPETMFLVYSLDRARKEYAIERGEETVDLHASLAAARMQEQRARIRMRAFWNMLLKDDLEVDRLPDAVVLIEQTKNAAGKIYERLGYQFPTSARAARAHAAFLQEFSLDIETAASLIQKAQHLEEAQAATAAYAAMRRRKRSRSRAAVAVSAATSTESLVGGEVPGPGDPQQQQQAGGRTAPLTITELLAGRSFKRSKSVRSSKSLRALRTAGGGGEPARPRSQSPGGSPASREALGPAPATAPATPTGSESLPPRASAVEMRVPVVGPDSEPEAEQAPGGMSSVLNASWTGGGTGIASLGIGVATRSGAAGAGGTETDLPALAAAAAAAAAFEEKLEPGGTEAELSPGRLSAGESFSRRNRATENMIISTDRELSSGSGERRERRTSGLILRSRRSGARAAGSSRAGGPAVREDAREPYPAFSKFVTRARCLRLRGRFFFFCFSPLAIKEVRLPEGDASSGTTAAGERGGVAGGAAAPAGGAARSKPAAARAGCAFLGARASIAS